MLFKFRTEKSHVEINDGDQFVVSQSKGTGLCSDGELIMDESTCRKGCNTLKVPEKEILGGYKCYIDGAGKCYQNGRNGGGAFMICKIK